MKKIFLFMVFCVMLFTACSKENKNHHDYSHVTDSELLLNLTSFNDSLFFYKPASKACMSSKEILNIVYCDLVGAYEGGKAGAWAGGKIGTLLGNPITGAAFGAFIGGIGFGAFRSWVASPNSTSTAPIDFDQIGYSTIADSYSKFILGNDDFLAEIESYDVKKQIVVDPDIVKDVNLGDNDLKVGQNHNIMLAGLQGKILSDEIIVTKVDNTPQIEETLEYRILYSSEMEDAFDGFYSDLKRTDQIQVESLPDQVIKLYSDLMLNYVSECNDIVFIINKYAECINNSSELSEEDKKNLNMGLATSLYSYNYWMQSELK